MGVSILVGTVALVVASTLAYLGLGSFLQGRQRRRKGRSANGTVVGYTEHQSVASCTYLPRVSFQEPGGREIIFTAFLYLRRKPTVGRQVQVLYHPGHPEDAEVASFSAFWLVPTVALGLAALFLLLSAVGYAGLLNRT